MKVPVKTYFTENLKNLCGELVVSYIPQYETEGSACCDVRLVCDEGSIVLQPQQTVTVPIGIHMEVPSGWEVLFRARSGLASKMSISVTNGQGCIDDDYRGEIHAILTNVGSSTVVLKRGERVGQLCIKPVYQIRFDEVENLESLSKTKRGMGGFGHTGRM